MQRTDDRRDDLPIPLRFRCPKRWAELKGDGARRHCASCDFHVHDVSAMTRPRAERFLAARDDRTCIMYRYRPDGSVVFAEPPWRARAQRWLARAGAVLALCLPSLAACRRSSTQPPAAAAGGASAAQAPRADEGELVGDWAAPGRVELSSAAAPDVAPEGQPLTDEQLKMLEALGY